MLSPYVWQPEPEEPSLREPWWKSVLERLAWLVLPTASQFALLLAVLLGGE